MATGRRFDLRSRFDLGLIAGMRAACTALLMLAALGSGGRASAAEPDSPCRIGFDSEPTTKPDVLDLRVTRAEALLDATVMVRLDGSTTSYTYVLHHVAVDASNARRSDGGRMSSKPIAIRLR